VEVRHRTIEKIEKQEPRPGRRRPASGGGRQNAAVSPLRHCGESGISWNRQLPLLQERPAQRAGPERAAPSRWNLAASQGTSRRVRPKLAPRVLLGRARLELIQDDLPVTDDMGIMPRLDDVRVPSAQLGLRPVIVDYP